jgi:hypothetical protein
MKRWVAATLAVVLAVTAVAPVVAQTDEELETIRTEYRSAKTAVLMSIPFPGWGQLYADSPFWALMAFGAQVWFTGNILLERRRQERQRAARDQETDESLREYRSTLVTEHGERARDFVWWSLGAALVISLDAYVSVQLADFDSNEPPIPDLDRPWETPAEDGEGLSLGLSFSF